MALRAERVPEYDRTCFELEVGDLELIDALFDFAARLAALAHPGEIPLHVRHENGHADAAETFRETLQRYGLAGAGSTCDETVPVGIRRQERYGIVRLREDDRLGHVSRGECL